VVWFGQSILILCYGLDIQYSYFVLGGTVSTAPLFLVVLSGQQLFCWLDSLYNNSYVGWTVGRATVIGSPVNTATVL